MDNTTDYPPCTPAEIQAMEIQAANEQWSDYAQQRIAHAAGLLDRIAHDIDTVPEPSREHAADLLDATIENLERLKDRFCPDRPQQPAHDPPF